MPEKFKVRDTVEIGKELVYPDGRTVTFLQAGQDEDGEYITLGHRMTQQGAVNGAHSHPLLKEKFIIIKGRMRFLVDGQEITLEAGEEIIILPNQVHQFWNVSDGNLEVIHEIRPPGQHWKMFVLMHKLECEGKLTKNGIPRNPLWLGVAWECIDGYLKGPPRFIQKIFLGGLARLAGNLGYKI
ncbi:MULTISPECIES: cupin domain-containing protein [Oceanobacillus]|uniref:Cupin domain protein n=2 Tax=Oceanobacillus TaxID=182709 RepID=A0A0A1MUT0_9BACI|nr:MULTISPECIES: cupin domain-containing protein [Oceanobacillus]UUI01394.1 cupin domain-containing protein [Oceanobacillus jeddahense]CEI82676.1 Cupin domain protein [Oceanobacillus oncorhynchi]